LVSVFDNSTNALIDSTVTDGNGDWTMQLDGALSGTLLRIEVQDSTAQPFVSESSTYSFGSVTDGQLQVTPIAGTAQNDIDVGVVSRPSLLLDQTQTAPANSSVRHAHRYTASTAGSLSLALSALSNPASPAWPTRLLLDQNCNGSIDTSDSEILGPIAVIANQELCFIVDVFVPASQALGSTHSASLSATLVLEDAAATGHAVQFVNQNTDGIRVVAASDGRLLLSKSVRNVSLGGAAVQSNTALPGHILEYTIAYENRGVGPISQLRINDSAPAYTQILGASVQCSSTPASLVCTPALASSDVRWDFTGNLPAGANGTVSYQVTID